jgi:hypothetical protein
MRGDLAERMGLRADGLWPANVLSELDVDK